MTSPRSRVPGEGVACWRIAAPSPVRCVDGPERGTLACTCIRLYACAHVYAPAATAHLAAAAADAADCMWARAGPEASGTQRCGRSDSPPRRYHDHNTAQTHLFMGVCFVMAALKSRWAAPVLGLLACRCGSAHFFPRSPSSQHSSGSFVIFVFGTLWGIMTTGQDESSVRVALR